MSDIKYHRLKIGEIKSGLQMIDRLTTGNLSHHKNYLRNLLNIYLRETEEVANGVITGEKQCNLPIVSQRSELLNALADSIEKEFETYAYLPDLIEHIKAFNCG